MTYRIHAHEAPEAALKRIALEEIDAGLAESGDPHMPEPVVVHQVRKRCKRVRGLVLLYRSELSHYRQANVGFRDASRRLATTRDANVAVETWKNLVGGLGDAERWDPVGDALAHHRDRANDGAQLRIAQFAEDFERLRPDIEAWSLGSGGWDPVAKDFERGYRSGREWMHKVRDRSGTKRLHTWRKHVKYHAYHVRLMQETSRRLQRRRARLRKLSEALGYVHDLAVLRTLVRQLDIDLELVGEVRRKIKEASRTARRGVRTSGNRLFAKKPHSASKIVRRGLKGWPRVR